MNDRVAADAPAAGGKPPGARWRLLACLWLAGVLALGFHQWHFWRASPLNADVLALLPGLEADAGVDRAAQLMAAGVSRQVVVLLGAPQWDAARRAAQAWRQSLPESTAALQPEAGNFDAVGDAVLSFYSPWRDRLLTPAQRRALADFEPASQVRRALTLVHQPADGRFVNFTADPMGLWGDWLQARVAQSRARVRDGELWVHGEGIDWVVLRYQITGGAFSMTGDAVFQPALEAALEAVRRHVPDARMVAAGLPLHAEAAAVRANAEVRTIGLGSLAAVLLLAWLTFRRFTPIALTALSLGIGVAAAVSTTAWVFGEVHLLTLVFGASLVGVAEDYGIHYFAARQGRPWAKPHALIRRLLPGMVLALGTSVVAYLTLAIAPFPGLRQMAVFSVAGSPRRS